MYRRSQLMNGMSRDVQTLGQEQVGTTNILGNSWQQQQMQEGIAMAQKPQDSSEKTNEEVSESVRYYVVKSGDSWWKIAEMFNISLFSLIQLNGMSALDPLPSDRALKVPSTPGTESLSQTSPTITPTQITPKQQEERSTSSNMQNGSSVPAHASVTPKPNGIVGYNPELGKRLASVGAREAAGRRRAGGNCYFHVANAVDAVIGRFLSGRHAYMAASQLAAKKNLFTEVPASNLSGLPAGAIVVWGKGTSDSGHISIAQGDGMELSDFIGPQMTFHYGGDSARVFLPKARM